MNLGDYIKEKRKKNGLTQLQLSEMLDIDDTTLSRIEKSKRKIQLNQIKKISKRLNLFPLILILNRLLYGTLLRNAKKIHLLSILTVTVSYWERKSSK
jgi:transcriptional regulator with XRE-family HTH domain